MPIVTVTGDWNGSAYYLPVLKGKIYSLLASAAQGHPSCKDVVIETISDTIEPFNIVQGCFVLKNSFRAFPKGTIHLMAVESEPAEGVDMVAVQYAGHWIVAPNDGRFSLLIEPAAMEKGEAVAYRIPLPDEFSTFLSSTLFAEAVWNITAGTFASRWQVCGLRSVAGGIPSVMDERIVGKVVYVDSYGNAITNISRETFARGYFRWRSGHEDDPAFRIYVGGPHLVLDTICNSYTDVESGEELALFNSAGLLELALRNGNFCGVESVAPNCEIMIKFYDNEKGQD